MSDFKKAVLFGALLGAIWGACYNVAHAGVVATTTNQSGGLIRFHDDVCAFDADWFQMDALSAEGTGNPIYGCWKWGGHGTLKAFFPFQDQVVTRTYSTKSVIVTPYGDAVFKGRAK